MNYFLFMCCLLVVSLVCWGGDVLWRAYQRYMDARAALRRDLKVALELNKVLKLENALLHARCNMMDAALAVKAKRGLYIVKPAVQ